MDTEWRESKNPKIGNGFDHGPTTNGSMAKRRSQFDLAYRIGLSTLCTGILIVVNGRRVAGTKNTRIGYSYNHGPSTSGEMDSVHRIGLSMFWAGILIVVGGHRRGTGIKNHENR